MANAKSTSATVKTTLAATPSAAVDGLNEGEDGQVNQSKGIPEPPMEASTTAESSTSACVVTRRSVSESVELEYIAPVPATTNLAGSTVGPESPPLIGTSEQVAITSTACPKKAAAAMTDGPTVGANDHVQQRPVLDSHHKPLLLPEDDITNNVNEGSCKTGKILQMLPRGEDSQNLPGKVHNKLLGAMSMYENMSLEVNTIGLMGPDAVFRNMTQVEGNEWNFMGDWKLIWMVKRGVSETLGFTESGLNHTTTLFLL